MQQGLLNLLLLSVLMMQALAWSNRMQFRGGSIDPGNTSISGSIINTTEDASNKDVDTSYLTTTVESLRTRGKSLHDAGKFDEAADIFKQAADAADDDEEYATCKLHEALCHLKLEEFEQASSACDGILVKADIDPALRARALHRKAKAALGLNDTATALQDARSAAFLGDKKAVALYGKLMRETSSSSSSPFNFMNTQSGGNDFFGGGDTGGSSLFESLLGKSSGGSNNNPFLSSTANDNSASVPSLFSGLVDSPLSLLSNNNDAGLAKSLLSSLTKKLDDESTQDSICRFFQDNASEVQLQQYANMAGVPLTQSNASRIASICRNVTPTTLKRTINIGKRIMYVTKLVRKVGKIMQKYRHAIVALCIISWAKSAIYRPLPVSKRALAAAMKESR